MQQNQPNLLPLNLILLGSCLLAIPGAGGGLFLFATAFDSISKIGSGTDTSNFLMMLLPVPVIIGFLLLGGYIWTAVKKRFVKWFWILSGSFNLILTLLSGGFVVKMFYENFKTLSTNDLPKIIFLLFPLWTLFVAIFSFKYAMFKPTDKDLNLP